MGGLIPNPHDDSVKQKLDKQFSDPHLRNLRNRIDKGHPPTEPNFFSDPGKPRHLARIAYRLKIWPDPDPQAGEPPPTTTQLKARWQYLLQVLLTDPIGAAQSGSTVAELIRNALQVFVVTDDPQTAAPGAPQCTAITFDVIQAPLPGALQYQVNITPALNARPAGNYVANIQLVCLIEIPQGVGANEPLPDPGEVAPSQPNLLAKKPKPKPKPKPKKPPKKRPAKKTTKKKKKAAKKVSKKAAKKAGKKAAKKAAKKTAKKRKKAGA
jgi:hypothetical protein